LYRAAAAAVVVRVVSATLVCTCLRIDILLNLHSVHQRSQGSIIGNNQGCRGHNDHSGNDQEEIISLPKDMKSSIIGATCGKALKRIRCKHDLSGRMVDSRVSDTQQKL
jgi:hypothetical protein